MTDAMHVDPVRGLATVALLKTEFDAGRDYLGMFMPFVYDSILVTAKHFFITDLQVTIRSRHGLTIPASILTTLLARAVRAKAVSTDGSRYSSTDELPADASLDIRIRQIEREHANLAAGLRDFAWTTTTTSLGSDEDCLALFLQFFDAHHIAIIASEQEPRFSEMVREDRSSLVLVARYLDQIYHHEPERIVYVRRMLEGFVLQNALFLKDISLATRRFVDLEVFLDTRLALDVLGHAGRSEASAGRELLSLLKATNARVSIFERTIDEMERILLFYRWHLATQEGLATLWPTPLTRHFVRNHYKPSDIAMAISLIRDNLTDLGVKIRQMPRREPRYTLNEAALTALLKRPDQSELDPRVTHDVDCIAAIMTLRRNRSVQSLDLAFAIFATPSRKVVHSVTQWFRECGEGDLPPIINSFALSNVAWLKKPGGADDLKVRELVALCSAALTPSAKTWTAFTDELKKLQKNETITSSERVAVIVSALVTDRLAEYNSAVDSATVYEIVTSVLEGKRDAELKVRALEKERTEAELAAESQRSDFQHAQEQAKKKLASALGLAEQRRMGLIKVERRLHSVARLLAGVLFFVLAALVFLSIWELPITMLPSWMKKIVAVLAAGLSFFHLLFGIHLYRFRALLESLMELKLRRWVHLDAAPEAGQGIPPEGFTDYPLHEAHAQPDAEGE